MPRVKTIYDVLEADHRHAGELMCTLETSADPAQRWNLFVELRSLLELHADCEATTLHRALADEHRVQELLDDAEHRHQQLCDTLADLEKLQETELWQWKLAELKSIIDDHRTAQAMLFAEAKQILPPVEAAELARHYVTQMRACAI